MLQNNPTLKTNSRHLPKIALRNPTFFQEVIPALATTPRCRTFKKEDYQTHQTQNLCFETDANSGEERLISIKRLQTNLKENLLDLDLFFNMETNGLCQTGLLSDRQNFVIRKIRTPSTSSKSKQNTAASQDSSLDAPKDEPAHKNATPSVEKKGRSKRGQSESKHMLTCRIVNSKKLPFDILPRRKKCGDILQELTGDISVIMRKESEEWSPDECCETLLGYL